MRRKLNIGTDLKGVLILKLENMDSTVVYIQRRNLATLEVQKRKTLQSTKRIKVGRSNSKITQKKKKKLPNFFNKNHPKI